LCSGILSDPLVTAQYLYPGLGTSAVIKTQVRLQRFEPNYHNTCIVVDPGCLPQFLTFTDPGSRIPDPGPRIQQQQQKEGGKNLLSYFFFGALENCFIGEQVMKKI
jgi:hypothetical protein